MKICVVCESIFKDYAIFVEGNCPLRNCCGEVIEIDENLYEAYKLLNEKDYMTTYCCSGHSYDEVDGCNAVNTYISFYGEVNFAKLPIGFKLERYEYINGAGNLVPSIGIRKKYQKDLTSIELQKQLWKTSIEVLEWAEKLGVNIEAE